MGPLSETTEEAGLLMWWLVNRIKSPADGGHSHLLQDSHPTGSELFLTSDPWKQKLRCKGEGNGFARMDRVMHKAFGVRLFPKCGCQRAALTLPAPNTYSLSPAEHGTWGTNWCPAQKQNKEI